jgi:hypothetical protein
MAADELRDRVTTNMRARAASETIAQIRQQQAAQMAADELRDRVTRRMAERRAADTIKQIREQQENARVSPGTRSAARDLIYWQKGADAQEAAERSVRKMKEHLSPMVAMANRLADEASDFRQQMYAAVGSGKMTLSDARLLTAEFLKQQRLMMDRARQEQAGFLGMRKMGFAAQQFGYAIEDAASVYGTMGLSGAFRAAGNNLTAMAATAGPLVGVTASIAAAAAAIGLHWWESSKGAESTKKEADAILNLTERINKRAEDLAASNEQSRDIARANHSELMSMYDANVNRIKEILQLEEARRIANESTADLIRLQSSLLQAESEVAKENAKWWQELETSADAVYSGRIRLLRDTIQGISEFSRGIGSLLQSDAAKKAADDAFNAATLLEIERNRQEAALKRANELERQRVELLQRQQEILEQTSAVDARLIPDGRNIGTHSRDMASIDRRFDVRQGRTMAVQNRGFLQGDRSMENTVINRDEGDLFRSQQELLQLRENMLEVSRNENTSSEERLRMQTAITRVNEELLHITEMRIALNEAGLAAERETNDMIMSRAESMNDELRFVNEIARARAKMEEEIAIARRADTMSFREEQALRRDFNDQVNREVANRDAAEGIRQRQERIGDLESQLSGMTPAQVMGGMARGTDQTRSFLEAERLRQQSVNDQEPVVAEIQGLRQQVRQLQAVMERNANAAPQAAEIF